MSGRPASEATHPGDIPVFESFLRGLKERVDARLAEILDAKITEATTHGPDVRAMAESIADLTRRGGKRLRPAMAMVGYVACGGHAEEGAVIDAGAALELLQTYLLTHDDWMDGDDLRRGGPSVHAMLGKHFGTKALGDCSAILAGDYASALAQEVLAHAPANPSRIVRAMSFFARMQTDAVYGQQLDIAGHAADVERMHDLKTGSYTVRGPLLLGALFADATEGQIAALVAFANPMGIAFQLRDDVLGAFGEASVTGKPYGNDIRAGKRTAILAEAEPRLDAPGRKVLELALGNLTASEEVIRSATAALDACGARDAVERRVSALVQSALDALDVAPFTERGRALLRGAASALTARRS